MISGVAKNFLSVTIIRIISRVLEFFLRVYLIREVLSAQILAQMVALDLILTTSLHITKSCFKLSYQQVQSKKKQQNILSSMNLMSIGVVATLISSIIVITLQWNHKIQTKYVNQTILLYGVCSILQALKQKYSVQFVLGYQYKKAAIIQLVSYLPKTFFLFFAAQIGLFHQYGILMFGFGNFIYYFMCLSLTFYLTKYKILLVRSFKYQNQQKDQNEQKLKDKNLIDLRDQKQQEIYLDNKTKQILKQLSYISILKLILQQFEKIVLVFKNAVEDSSIYSLVSNLGSIIVRFLFAPLQQISYNYYARGSEQQSKKTLFLILRIITIMFFLCVGFGFRYAENVLFILYGQKWVNHQSILAFQCFMFLVGIMGINGTIDSFVLARADIIHTAPKLKYFTVLTTIIYFSASLLFLHFGLGAAGLFLGNSVGMISRIIINWNIEIKKHTSLIQFIKGIFPHKLFIILLVSLLLASYQIKRRVKLNFFIDFLIGIIFAGITVLPVLYQNKNEFITFIKSKGINKQKQL